MKKVIFMLTAVIFIFTACQKEEALPDPTATPESGFHKSSGCPDIVTKMIANGGSHDQDGDGIEVGTITVHDDGNTITVTYQITELGWVIDGIHLYVDSEYTDDTPPEPAIPSTKKGNPKIGHFPYNLTYPGVTEVIVEDIPSPADGYVIAAHANVSYDGAYPDWTLENFCESLPDYVTIDVAADFIESYLNIEVSDDEWLNGEYPGWCIDVDEPISESSYTDVAVYCLDEADDIVKIHGNLHMVAWLINQHYVGETSGCSDGIYTYADVQYAIWLLVDPEVPDPDDVGELGAIFVEDLDECRALEIVADAEDYADINDPFEPGCGETTVVVLDPGVGIQKLIIEFPLECDQETAWGYGYWINGDQYDTDGADGISFTDSPDYGGNAWGWYFGGCGWTPPPPPPPE